MSPLRELLARVASQPNDEEARLACAELLRDDDAPRAELIRSQVALSARGLDPAQRRSLRHRVEVLLRENEAAWRGRLTALGVFDFQFSRGFVEEVGLTERALAEHGEALFALEPVHRLRLEVRDGEGLARAAAQPWFEQVRWLKLTGEEGADSAVRALASAAHAGRLEGLVLPQVDPDGVAALVESVVLTGLRSLSLTGNDGFGDECAEALAESRLSLVRLYLSATGLSDEGVSVLARAKPLRSLELLALNRNEISDEGAQALAASKALANLQRLELKDTQVDEEGALAFSSPRALPKLRHLDLQGIGLSARALELLLKRLGMGVKL
ncbi:TIGR02996 domain-containing protein [Archangium violaceum]|uniref:TIGR02996 domain-containing protein n=1 Tax=Archangium violaceum TaxID=83451 RepID=UPI002B312904|nr:TIGR02996 domain-containing protein [Archangium violaceum]